MNTFSYNVTFFVSLLFLITVAVQADNITNAHQPLSFGVNDGKGNQVDMVSFDSSYESDAQATCNMTPNGATPAVQPTIEVPPFEPKNEDYGQVYDNVSPLRSVGYPPPNPPNGGNVPPSFPPHVPLIPNTPLDPPNNAATPEPAAMLIVGLGFAGLALVRRKK